MKQSTKTIQLPRRHHRKKFTTQMFCIFGPFDRPYAYRGHSLYPHIIKLTLLFDLPRRGQEYGEMIVRRTSRFIWEQRASTSDLILLWFFILFFLLSEFFGFLVGKPFLCRSFLDGEHIVHFPRVKYFYDSYHCVELYDKLVLRRRLEGNIISVNDLPSVEKHQG